MKIFNVNVPIDIELEQFESQIDLVREYQKYAYIILVLIMILYAYFWFINPKLDQINQSHHTFERFSEVLQRKKSTYSEKEKLENALVLFHKQLTSEKKRYFLKTEFQEFSINILPELARRHHVRLYSIAYPVSPTALSQNRPSNLQNKPDVRGATPAQSQLKPDARGTVAPVEPPAGTPGMPLDQRFEKMTMIVQMDGNFTDITDLLAEIESYPKILSMSRFSLTRKSINPTVVGLDFLMEAFLLTQ